MPPAHDYSAYIWPAYGLTALVFAAMIGASLAHARRWRRLAQTRAAQARDVKR